MLHFFQHFFLQERGPKKQLKCAAHGQKLKEWVPLQLPREMERLVTNSGLAHLQRSNMTKIDPNLITVFVER